MARGKERVPFAVIMKVIACNIKRFMRYWFKYVSGTDRTVTWRILDVQGGILAHNLEATGRFGFRKDCPVKIFQFA